MEESKSLNSYEMNSLIQTEWPSEKLTNFNIEEESEDWKEIPKITLRNLIQKYQIEKFLFKNMHNKILNLVSLL